MQSEAKCRGGSAKIGWSDKKLSTEKPHLIFCWELCFS
ncbi:hypothetical protein BDL97_17G042700 [Sphagnum fallax]|nr:hypothetical protein BDL97_17G042700 [Sphagnum fallax]